MNPDISTSVGQVRLENPFLLASGIVGAGKEYLDFIEIEKLGGIVTKTITMNPRAGNRPPRLWETPSGMLNSIGLENKGYKGFMAEYADFLSGLSCAVIVSIAGSTEADLQKIAARTEEMSFASAIELNLSCPNVEKGGKSWAQSVEGVERAMDLVRPHVKKPLWVKLTVAGTDITLTGCAAENKGANAISAINTIPGIEIDPYSLEPRLGNLVGGLSGAAIRPVAIKAVHDLYLSIEIPVIGIGGIGSINDALQFFAMGAKSVQIGSCIFSNPSIAKKITGELIKFLQKKNINTLENYTGSFHAKKIQS